MALAPDNARAPVPALLTLIYLWGHRFTKRPDLPSPDILLNRALSQIGNAASKVPSQRAVQVIQAHILLGCYLYDAGRILEAHQQTLCAVSLVQGLGLYATRSVSDMGSRTTGLLLTVEVLLPPPEDAIEEGERIGAFWMTFRQDRLSSTILGVPIALGDADDRVTVPWPLAMEMYERGKSMQGRATDPTIPTFLSGSLDGADHTSRLAQSCKVALLFERATRFAGTGSSDEPLDEQAYIEYNTLTLRTEELKVCVLSTASFVF